LAAAVGEGLGAGRNIATPPNFGGNAVAAEFAGNGGWGTAQGGPDGATRFTVCMQTVNLDSVLQRELGVGSAHGNTSYTRCCTCSVNLGGPGLDSHLRGNDGEGRFSREWSMGLRPTQRDENRGRPSFSENKRLNTRLSTERSEESRSETRGTTRFLVTCGSSE
jgi:hypothetical protein